uniref:Lymphocyte antigen 86 n=1 Tax=Monodelphis domestica TaxID=13616 RepID=F6VTR9_MONDO
MESRKPLSYAENIILSSSLYPRILTFSQGHLTCHLLCEVFQAPPTISLLSLLKLLDPLQDLGFSMDHCNNPISKNLKIRFGVILRHDIQELFLDINLFSMGKSILSYSYPVCEVDFPKFSFCGKKKGEKIYYAGDINNQAFPIGKVS